MAFIQVTEAPLEHRCKVVESLGYVQDMGAYAKVVMHGGKERTAVKRGGQWVFWGARDRVKPLVDHMERCAREGRDPFQR